MPRPRKRRRVGFKPETMYFKPRGVPLRDLKEIELKVEELEAIRLKHKEKLSQEEAAEEMGVSRTTFSRILDEANSKICNFLINGNALRVRGGSYTIEERSFKCQKCGYEWIASHGGGRPQNCPECGNNKLKSTYKTEKS